jgi:hypothetical protein
LLLYSTVIDIALVLSRVAFLCYLLRAPMIRLRVLACLQARMAT